MLCSRTWTAHVWHCEPCTNCLQSTSEFPLLKYKYKHKYLNKHKCKYTLPPFLRLFRTSFLLTRPVLSSFLATHIRSDFCRAGRGRRRRWWIMSWRRAATKHILNSVSIFFPTKGPCPPNTNANTHKGSWFYIYIYLHMINMEYLIYSTFFRIPRWNSNWKLYVF